MEAIFICLAQGCSPKSNHGALGTLSGKERARPTKAYIHHTTALSKVSPIFCLKARFWGIMADFDNIIVSNSGIINALKTFGS